MYQQLIIKQHKNKRKMKTIKMLNGKFNNKAARIQKVLDLEYYYVTRIINKDHVLETKGFKTLKGAEKFAKNHIA